MTIPAIGAITAAFPSSASLATSFPTGPTGIDDAGAAGASTASDFASALGKSFNAVQTAQSNADSLAVQAATGDLTNIHDYTIAATQASLVTELAAAIRTKGVDAFNQIMGMQA